MYTRTRNFLQQFGVGAARTLFWKKRKKLGKNVHVCNFPATENFKLEEEEPSPFHLKKKIHKKLKKNVPDEPGRFIKSSKNSFKLTRKICFQINRTILVINLFSDSCKRSGSELGRRSADRRMLDP